MQTIGIDFQQCARAGTAQQLKSTRAGHERRPPSTEGMGGGVSRQLPPGTAVAKTPPPAQPAASSPSDEYGTRHTVERQSSNDDVPEMPNIRRRRRSSFELIKDAITGLIPSWSASGGQRDSSFSYKRRTNIDPRNSKNSDAGSRSQSVFGTVSVLDAAARSNVGDGADGSALVIQHPALVDEDGNTAYTVPVKRERRSD